MGSLIRRLRQRSAPVASPGSTIVYGVGCVWWDSIDKAGRRDGSGLPCCPHCASVLLQVTEREWWTGAMKQESTQPGYSATLRWSRGRCFKTWTEATEAHAVAVAVEASRG